ncbi:MAG: LuxR C-terminal-related transcriptional regulator [Saprospiraceae bacterium]
MLKTDFMVSLNVVVADDHPIFVEGLQSVLKKSAGRFNFNIKGVVQNVGELAELLQHNNADLILMDLQLSDPESLKILPSVKKRNAETRVLIMAPYDDPRLIKAAFKAGADGYMLKSGTSDELLAAIERLAEGETYMSKALSLGAYNGANTAGDLPVEELFARRFQLTKREVEIMRLIGQALSNREIADRLFISDQTVSVHRKNIMRKLGVKSTANLIKIAFEHHLV